MRGASRRAAGARSDYADADEDERWLRGHFSLPPRRGPAAAAPAAGEPEGGLEGHVLALGEVVLQNDVHLRQMLADLEADPAKLRGLAEENAALAAQGGEARSEASELAAARQRLEREAQRARRQVEDLSDEREVLLARLRAAEEREERARGAADAAARALDLERIKGEEARRTAESAQERCRRKAQCAEERAAAAMREVSRLEASGAATRAEAARAAEEAAQGQQRAALLEASLGEVLERQRATASREREATQRLASVRSERDELLAAEEATRSELVDSERHAEETERKAHGVARELVETTEAISRLRAEATAQPLLQQELEEALREEGALEHRLEARWREARQGPEAAASPRLRGASAASAAEQELRRLRSSQERAENEALREAWEAASRERRETEAKLAALQADWLPLREVLVRLTTGAHRWRGGLFAVGEAGKRTAHSALVPPPPAESAWSCDADLPEVVRALCDSLEAMSVESMRDLAERRAAAAGGRGPAAAESWAAEGSWHAPALQELARVPMSQWPRGDGGGAPRGEVSSLSASLSQSRLRMST